METHVCPWWIGYLLASPIRRLIQNPEEILRPYLRQDMQILEIGPGMGFFTLPMARMIGPAGKIYAVDVQEKMLASLIRRAKKANLIDRIETRLSPGPSLNIENLAGRIDFALAFAVLHEIPDIQQALASITASLKDGGVLMIAEPQNHVNEDEFQTTVTRAQNCGLIEKSNPVIKRSHSIVMIKQGK
jgi:ubiquinone/menaquinone biosynthesis C-methylase UbiE